MWTGVGWAVDGLWCVCMSRDDGPAAMKAEADALKAGKPPKEIEQTLQCVLLLGAIAPSAIAIDCAALNTNQSFAGRLAGQHLTLAG